MREEPQILARWYDFLRYLSPQVAKFPRSERYLLGERLEQASFDVLELLLESVYAANKIERLMKANIRLEQARYYTRLCKDLKLINLHRYEVISGMIDEVGRQLGGWIRQQRAKT